MYPATPWMTYVLSALVAFPILALIFGLAYLDIGALRRKIRARTPVKGIAGYLIFVAIGTGGLWIAQSLRFAFGGEIPQFIIDAAHPTSVVFALDLTLVVPFLLLGAAWLWKWNSWGYVVAAILSVKGALYMFALAAVTVAQTRAGISGALAQLPVYGLLSLGFLFAAVLLVGNVRPEGAKRDSPPAPSHSGSAWQAGS